MSRDEIKEAADAVWDNIVAALMARYTGKRLTSMDVD